MRRSEFIPTAAAAKLLGVSRQTLYNWIAEGRVREPFKHPNTGRMQWKAEDIQRIRLQQQEGEAA